MLALESGCGCGAVSFGFALLAPSSRCIGIEKQEKLVLAARRNAQALNLSGRCQFFAADLADLPPEILKFQRKADLVMANPPWRNPARGLVTAQNMRKKAYWRQKNTLPLFLKSASALLRRHGRFCLILPHFLLSDFFESLKTTELGLRKILPVCSFANAPVSRLLLLCQKNAASDYEISYPLAIHEKREGVVGYTGQARAFCPWLAD